MSVADPPLWVAARVASTHVEGPHRRAAIWVAGCQIRCPGCCNPDMFERSSGEPMSADTIVDGAAANVEGLTVLGGEPLEQIPALTIVAARAQHRGLGVVVFSGMTMAQARRKAGFAALWSAVDSMVLGPFVAGRPEPAAGRATIGSSNQRLIHRTPRYADPALWHRRRGAEAHVDRRGEITLIGDPRLVAGVRRRLRA